MITEAKIFSSLRNYIPNSNNRLDGDKWEVIEGASVADALSRERVLNGGDVLHVFPLMAGG